MDDTTSDDHKNLQLKMVEFRELLANTPAGTTSEETLKHEAFSICDMVLNNTIDELQATKSSNAKLTAENAELTKEMLKMNVERREAEKKVTMRLQGLICKFGIAVKGINEADGVAIDDGAKEPEIKTEGAEASSSSSGLSLDAQGNTGDVKEPKIKSEGDGHDEMDAR